MQQRLFETVYPSAIVVFSVVALRELRRFTEGLDSAAAGIVGPFLARVIARVVAGTLAFIIRRETRATRAARVLIFAAVCHWLRGPLPHPPSWPNSACSNHEN